MTGGFVAFAGATEFLSASVDAARDAGVAQRQLAAQMKASGQSFTDVAGRDRQGRAVAGEVRVHDGGQRAGADGARARHRERITEAIKLQGARRRPRPREEHRALRRRERVAKVFGGQETALRRAVPGLEKHAHGLDLIAEAQQRLAGQAAAGTTVAERFSATLHDTEMIVGNALLPTINKLLTSLGNWLTKMNESGKLQRDVNSAVKTGTALFQALVAVGEAAHDRVQRPRRRGRRHQERGRAARRRVRGVQGREGRSTSIATAITGVRRDRDDRRHLDG